MNALRLRPRRAPDALAIALVALATRAGVAWWAADRIPPTADGSFYHVIASRVAGGLGYTWLWPDGVVTYAAHYPVGYPALVGAAYWLFGSRPVVAMVLNAVLGAAAAVAVHALASRATTRWRALGVGLVAALHVGLVAYTPALMTEGVTSSLCVMAAWVASKAREQAGTRARGAWVAALGAVLGVCALVRPQSLLLAPAFGWLSAGARAGSAARGRLGAALLATAVAAAVCAPWVVRNRARMGHAALSFNGGWNLLIGTSPVARGTWAPIAVPSECKLVFDEAEKDICFGRAAVRRIAEHPAAWAALVPAKLSATFDYCGAAGWYLHAAAPSAFSAAAKLRLGVLETGLERALLATALVAMGFARGPRRRARAVAALASAVPLLTPHAWPSFLGLAAVLALRGRALGRDPVALPAALVALVATGLSHAVFFGAGRYSLVVFPFVTALAGGLLTAGDRPGDTPAPEGDAADAPDRDRGGRPPPGAGHRE